MNYPTAIVISAALLSAAIIARPAISQNAGATGMIVPIVARTGSTLGVWELWNGQVRKCWLGPQIEVKNNKQVLKNGKPHYLAPMDRETWCNKWSGSK
jgi:hypothetical protein